MPDVVEEILSWPVDQATNDSFDYFNYDSNNIDTATYSIAAGLNDGSTPANDGGQWSGAVPGYIDFIGYFEISFFTKLISADKWLEVTNVEFALGNSFASGFITKNFYLTYSLNVDFSNSVILYDFPAGNIEGSVAIAQTSFSYSFSAPIILEPGSNIYFRFYPYNANEIFSFFTVFKNTFFINGVIRDTSTVPSISTLSFTKDCSPSNSLTWQM